MQALVPLHLVTVGVGIAWVVRMAVNSSPKPKGVIEPGDAAGAVSVDEDLERSATQWLARSCTERSSTQSPGITEHGAAQTSSYAELELLAEGDFVYLRSGDSVLTAPVPTVRQLMLQPLQLVKGKPDAVPTAPMEAISVWLVRRNKQQVAFELLGLGRRHILEADLSAPHGVALASGSAGKRGLWNITPHGLASVRWPAHVLSLRVVAVQLFDALAVKSVRDGLGHKLAEVGTKLRQEEFERTQAEAERLRLETELNHVRTEAASQIAELRAQLDVAIIARHAAEREVATLQNQKADEVVRAKIAVSRASQAESAAQLGDATVRRQQQQIQGMLAGHAEELRTLQQELQIAREVNEGLKRAMREQILSLQGALELRDARILELEEENDRMDTVLQVIQTQLGSGALAFPTQPRGSSGGRATPQTVGRFAAAAASAAAGAPPPTRLADDATGAADGARPLGAAADADAGCRPRGSDDEISLSSIVGALAPPPKQQQLAGSPMTDEPPLWRSLLDMTGDLSVTALKESLAISRRNTLEDAPVASVAWEPVQRPQPKSVCTEGNEAAQPLPITSTRVGPQPSCTDLLGPTRRISSAGSAAGEAGRAVEEHWGSGGGSEGASGGDADAGAEDTFVSAAVRMGGHLRLTGGGSTSTPLRQQQPQVSGATGSVGGVGFPSAAQSDPAGTGADAAARHGNPGGLRNATPAAVGTPSSVTPASGGAGAVAGVATLGRSPAHLEYGIEATLTLDSLRRRMRQLDAERLRLELLRVSLEESLPWRGPLTTGEGVAAGASPLTLCLEGFRGNAAATATTAEPAAAAAEAAAATPHAAEAAECDGGAALAMREDEQSGHKQPPTQLETHSQACTQTGLQGQSSWYHHHHHKHGVDEQLRQEPQVGGLDEHGGSWQSHQEQQQSQAREGRGESPRQVEKEEEGRQHPAVQHVQLPGLPSPGCVAQEEEAVGNVTIGQRQRRTDGGCLNESPAPSIRSPCVNVCGRAHTGSSTVSAAIAAASPPLASRIRCVSERRCGGGGPGGNEAPPPPPPLSTTDAADAGLPGSVSCASAEGPDNGQDAEDSLMSSFCSSDDRSGNSMSSRRADVDAGCMGIDQVPAAGSVRVDGGEMHAGDSLDGQDAKPRAWPNAVDGDSTRDEAALSAWASLDYEAAGGALLAPAGALNGAVFNAAGLAAALCIPGLRIHGNIGLPYGPGDSTDGLCNLGSTRTLPTARCASGCQTARRVEHSRPLSGVEMLPPALPLGSARRGEAIACSPGRLGLQHQPGAAAAAAAASTPSEIAAEVVTPKSYASTTGPADMSTDDDGLALCDEQMSSPPPAMLLGTLDELRSAAAASTSGADGSGVSRVGGRLLSGLEEEDE